MQASFGWSRAAASVSPPATGRPRRPPRMRLPLLTPLLLLLPSLLAAAAPAAAPRPNVIVIMSDDMG